MRRTKYETSYQIVLLLLAIVVVAVGSVFFYRELFPEYKRYQTAYIDLEVLNSGKKPPFKKGIKQILYKTEGPGPEQIDRCISCHVATELPHFSPTTIARDINGNMVIDATGSPVQVPNPDYVFDKVKASGNTDLQFIKVGELEIDLAKVLQMHPLLGDEVRPFQYHPMEEYGCTTCHSGNGRSVQTKRAHGPVFDQDYEPDAHTSLSPYVEVDEENDPLIATVYNFKPSDDLLFQTTPLLPGPLMEAKCAQCHMSGQDQIDQVVAKADVIQESKQRQLDMIERGLKNEHGKIKTLTVLRELLNDLTVDEVVTVYEKLEDPSLSPDELDAYVAQIAFLKQNGSRDAILDQIDAKLSNDRTDDLQKALATGNEALIRFERAKEPLTRLPGQVMDELAPHTDTILGNYERGKELYITQACYACHRIDGVSRGNVGPDLTEIGLSYPWYVKASIVWPQGKLKGSAMPNFKLDHEEVGDLLAFLMAQTGDPKALSEIDRDQALKAWESDHKGELEEAIKPTDITDTSFGMTVFATQGCAACHKLKGFDGGATFTTPRGAQWFRETFNEQISGRDLAHTIGDQAGAIEDHITVTQENTILGQLRQTHPGVVESFYTNFKVAARAVSDKQAPLLDTVFRMYVQEYGLGRDIAPRLHWSGIWRDNEWLTGHFLNPTAYTARSIMPVFPFDTSKFYSLNHMLHTLGKKNRDWLHEIWAERGYQPELAYQLQCAVCHGEHKHGNGVVSEWIYPVPKNLRNPLFLKNLTRENARLSITEGVTGTPMPPWGQVAVADVGDNIPVMTEDEIEHMVDWLFTSLPSSGFSDYEVTKKWSYTTGDIEKEMKGAAVFDDNMIKDTFFTPVNVATGQALFIEHCAHCHGPEGGGNGPRAEAMFDAKPRILSNLPWLESRDDLRLLRSIKFGVAGTSMQPFGDQTTPLQRIQLVVFIRDLAKQGMQRRELEAALYNTFDATALSIESCRAAEYVKLQAIKSRYDALRTQRENEEREVSLGTTTPADAANTFAAELIASQEVERRESLDQALQKIIGLIYEEKELFLRLGDQLLTKNLPQDLLDTYLLVIEERGRTYESSGGCVVAFQRGQYAYPPVFAQKLEKLIKQEMSQHDVLEGMLPSQERSEAEDDLNRYSGDLINMHTLFLSQMRQAGLLREKQNETFREYERIHASLL